jgi:glycosyltransferase involved in cell wall biosynthesis
MTTPILSILTPAVPARMVGALAVLVERIAQISAPFSGQVEHLVFMDNKRRPVGAKRQALLDIARGEYVAFVDDDDWVTPDYLAELLPRCQSGPDVVTFLQTATINGQSGTIHFDATCHVDEPWAPNAVARRRPWHVCAWRRALAVQGVFTEVNYGEDRAWVDQVAPLARNTLHIPRILHHYRHSTATTEAPPPQSPLEQRNEVFRQAGIL